MIYASVSIADVTINGRPIRQFTARILVGNDDNVCYQQVYNSTRTGALGEKIAENEMIAETMIVAQFSARLGSILANNIL